jgi:hypothetical protein
VLEAALVDVEARIAELVEARRPELERLVAQAVGAELARLVDAELERAVAWLANGSGATPTSTSAPCSECGERPRAPGRTVCQACRSRRDRTRAREHRSPAAGDDDGGPRAADART